MRVALLNPPWSFEGSIYSGCREPHLPLEYGYAKALLERAGHEAEILDPFLEGASLEDARRALADFRPEMTVLTTAPSYLFWRCAPPELRVAQETAAAVRDDCGALVVVGPHASTTPASTLRKLGADAAVLGEPEEVLVALAGAPRRRWHEVPSVAVRYGATVRVNGGPHASDLKRLPALRWPTDLLEAHGHHHHRFEAPAFGPGAELEASRGHPHHCAFCAKDELRDRFRKRPLETVLDELDALAAQGVTYVYFIDEIFVPDRPLLEALARREIAFGVQMRIDQWSPEMLELLGRAGCVSVEAGIESITPGGPAALDERCRLSAGEPTGLLLHAKKFVPFVQGNLLDSAHDDPAEVDAWRDRLRNAGIWANGPVPMFPYPGSPAYTRRWGPPDDVAWERAVGAYLAELRRTSEIQEAAPRPIEALEQDHA